jgi:hypothetical protein
MDLNKKNTGRIKTSRLLLCVAIWWLFLGIGYMIISYKIDKFKKDITRTGVALLHEVTDRTSLPLLEYDLNSLRKILQDVEKKPGVLYASIIDHKNKIVAYTDPGQLIPDKSKSVSRSDHVFFWEGSSVGHSRIINFSTDLTYSGTKIGEIFLTFSATFINRMKYGFIFTAVSSFIILVLVLTGLYFKGFRSITHALKARYSKKLTFPLGFSASSNIACPLCGAEQTFSRERFTDINLDRFLIIQSARNVSDLDRFRPPRGISLSEISNREDLAWLKRQVVLRCIEIIKRLSVE